MWDDEGPGGTRQRWETELLDTSRRTKRRCGSGGEEVGEIEPTEKEGLSGVYRGGGPSEGTGGRTDPG